MSKLLPLFSVNGVIGARLSPLDRGFAYGDGLFETCRVTAGAIPLWKWHFERLQLGCERLIIPLDHDQLDQYLARLLTAAEIVDGILKIIISRGEGTRGYRLAEKISPTYCLIFSPSPIDSGNEKGVAARVCQQRLGTNPVLAGIKHLNRLENVLARAEWCDEGFAEGLLLDEKGDLIEATASNVFIFRSGELFTPDLSRSGVAGVMRRIIIEQLAPTLRIPVRIEKITLADLYAAEEIFLCNSVFGIWPVLQVVNAGAAEYPHGLFTQQLQQALKIFLLSGHQHHEVAQ